MLINMRRSAVDCEDLVLNTVHSLQSVCHRFTVFPVPTRRSSPYCLMRILPADTFHSLPISLHFLSLSSLPSHLPPPQPLPPIPSHPIDIILPLHVNQL